MYTFSLKSVTCILLRCIHVAVLFYRHGSRMIVSIVLHRLRDRCTNQEKSGVDLLGYLRAYSLIHDKVMEPHIEDTHDDPVSKQSAACTCLRRVSYIYFMSLLHFLVVCSTMSCTITIILCVCKTSIKFSFIKLKKCTLNHAVLQYPCMCTNNRKCSTNKVNKMHVHMCMYRILPKISPLPSLTSKFLHRFFTSLIRPPLTCCNNCTVSKTSARDRPQCCYSLSKQFLSFACVLFLLNKVTKAWKYAQKVTSMNVGHNRQYPSPIWAMCTAEKGGGLIFGRIRYMYT